MNTLFTARLAAPVIVIIAIGSALVACARSTEVPDEPVDTSLSAESLLADYGLDGLDARALVDRLDALPLESRETGLKVSVRPDELVITSEDGREASLAMPDDAFYVSIAPFIDETHDCYFHSLTTCTGEMRREMVHVTVVDAETGAVFLAEDRMTHDNGFMGMWLPRDATFDVTVGYEGRSATTVVSTGDADDATCVTGMRLR